MNNGSGYFIEGEEFETDNSNAECFEAIGELAKKDRKSQPKLHYKLGEEIANGVKYFGQDKLDKNSKVTSMCICPNCGEVWRVMLSYVKTGKAKGCGCGKKHD